MDLKDSEINTDISSRLGKLRVQYGEIYIMSNTDEANKLTHLISSIKTTTFSITLVIGVFGLVNLINSIKASIIEKKAILGMLKAVGVTRNQIYKVILVQSLYSIMISWILGCLISFVLCIAINYFNSYALLAGVPIAMILMLFVLSSSVAVLISYIFVLKLYKDDTIAFIDNI